MLALLDLCLRQHCQFLMLMFSVKNNFFLDGINNKADHQQCQIINFLKISILKKSIKKYSRSRCHKFNIYKIIKILLIHQHSTRDCDRKKYFTGTDTGVTKISDQLSTKISPLKKSSV
jgi:hypothetical protein